MFVTSKFYISIVFSFSWELNGLRRNWKQCLCNILGWQTKSIMVCYGIFWSGQLPSFFTLIMTICPKIANCFRKGQKENKTTSVYRLMFLILYGCDTTYWDFDWNNKQTEKAFLLTNRKGKAQISVPTQSCSKASKYFDNWTSPSTQYNISARVFPELSFE